MLKADDLRGGPGGVQQAADVGGITGDDISVELRCGMRNDSVHYVTGAGAAQQVPGCVCVLLGQGCDLAAAQSAGAVALAGGTG